VGERGLDISGSQNEQVTASCECGNELSVFVQCGMFFPS
jgi:hypothetical protein